MSLLSLRVVVLGVLFLALLPVVTPLKVVDRSIVTDSFLSQSYYILESFGFDELGEIRIQGHSSHVSDGPPPAVFVFSQKYYQQVFAKAGAYKQAIVCASQAESASRVTEIPLDGEEHKFSVTQKGILVLVVLDCSQDATSRSLDAVISYTLLSSPGQELSLEDVPLPTIFIGSVIGWVILVLVFGLDMALHRSQLTPIHTFLLIVSASRMLITGMTVIYWKLYELEGSRYPTLLSMRNLAFSFSELGLCALFFLLAHGWRITQGGVPRGQVKVTFFAGGIFALTLAFFSFVYTDYYRLDLAIFYFFIVPKLFTILTRNAASLELQHDLIIQRLNGNRFDLSRITGPLNVKLKALRHIRNLIAFYVGGMLFHFSLVTFYFSWASWSEAWISSLFAEALVMLVFAYTHFTLRPRDNGLFYITYEQSIPITAMQRLLQDGELDDAVDNMPEPWDLSKTIVVDWPQTRTEGPRFLSMAFDQSADLHGKTD